MAAIGGAIALMAVIAIITDASAFQGGSNFNFNDPSGNASISSQVSAGIGVYLEIAAGAAAAVFGYMTEWTRTQP